jgi:hypothetical protein
MPPDWVASSPALADVGADTADSPSAGAVWPEGDWPAPAGLVTDWPGSDPAMLEGDRALLRGARCGGWHRSGGVTACGPVRIGKGGFGQARARQARARQARARQDRPGAGLTGAGITPVRGGRQPAGAAPRRRRCTGVLSLGHTRGSPAPAELLILGLSCLHGHPGGGATARRRCQPPRERLQTDAQHAVHPFGGPGRAGHTSPPRLSNVRPVIVQPRGVSIRP